MSIVIFSREIRSGKTTELLQWCKGRDGVAGILMPDVDGKRMFYDITRQNYFDALSSFENANDFVVGRYRFSKAAFDRATGVLHEAIASIPQYLVVDEVGKLELNKEGFYHAMKPLLIAENKTQTRLILVVRDTLLNEVTSCFNINPYKLVHDLKEL